MFFGANQRIVLNLSLVFAPAGGIVGAAVFRLVGTDALFYPAGLTLAVAAGYGAYSHYARMHPPEPPAVS